MTKKYQQLQLELPLGKKIYFASDNHLGLEHQISSAEREKIFVKWLNTIQKDAYALFLLGDLFDFWFEYDCVVPKGFVRVLGKLAELSDQGIKIYFFVGNHDLWLQTYFEKELNIPTFFAPIEAQIGQKLFFIAHGDGLGPKDTAYKLMKKVFTCKLCQFLYRWLHPDIGVRLAQYLSKENKLISGEEDINFLGEDKEWLILYAKRKITEKPYNYLVFGHRHLPMVLPISENSKYVNTGDWISYFSFVEYDGKDLTLQYFKP